MHKNRIRYIIILMSLALIGLIGLQFYWVKNAMGLQELHFNQNVNLALNEVVDKLEKKEAAGFLARRIQNIIPRQGQANGGQSPNVRIYSNGMHFEGFVNINGSDTSGRSYKKVIIKKERQGSLVKTESRLIINGTEMETGSEFNILKEFLDTLGQITVKNKLLLDIFKDLNMGEDIRERIDPEELDSLIRVSLANHGANAAFEWGIYNKHMNNFLLPSPDTDVERLMQSPFRFNLYPSSIYPKPDFLTLYFPGKSNFLLKKMWLVLMSSAVFILLIVFSFSYTTLGLIRQKKLSEVKTDFINNMTHEFKTPVSTILLASEALKEAGIRQNEERFNRLVNIIHDENNRIGGHVEKVLQLAAMEKGNFKISPEESDIHHLITEVVESMNIQAENRQGKIQTFLNAENPRIRADEFHFSNVIRNLLDNALKYCENIPDISVRTSNEGNKLLLSVEDNGIGLSKEQQGKVFDKFYRAATGNVHDVKGFGLGLHYVKTIVEMHGGTIKVKSEKGKGSNFEILLDNIT
jgi:two-component system, OmpR family, phosphate regulon sensor histidine kinase PhoR